MKAREYTNIQNYIDSRATKLLVKKDLIEIALRDPDSKVEILKKMKAKDIRKLFGFTHLINGKYRNMEGHCFKCLMPLRPDYTIFENYCKDCE